jgi:hypothetical protein
MAMNARHDHDIESVTEPVLREFHPKPVRLEAVDPERVDIRYDLPSDTLIMHLFGRGRGSVSVPIDRYLYVMVDPDTEEIIGIHIEGFLAQAVKEHPRHIDLLDFAELRGLTPADVRELQRPTVGIWHQVAWLTFARNTSDRRTKAISSFLGETLEPPGLLNSAAA